MKFNTLFLEKDAAPQTHIVHLYPQYALESGVHTCFSENVVDDIELALDEVARMADDQPGLSHVIIKSDAPVFCLGGDLATMVRCARAGDQAELTRYILKACRFGHRIHGHLHPRVHTIALVEGTALGAGFEVALGCETLIVEQGVKLGLPEIVFGSFAGVGAYSFLARLVGQTTAGRMMISGKNYSSEQLLDMGVVDHMTEKGQGLKTAIDLAQKQSQVAGALIAMKKVKSAVNPVTLTELETIGLIWIDSVMALSSAQLDIMEGLIKAQQLRMKK